MQQNTTDKRLLLLNDNDNTLVVIQSLKKDENIHIKGKKIKLSQDINIGFKLANTDIIKDNKILKYGVVIGVATSDIKQGDIVHFHNIASTYMATTLKQEQIQQGKNR